VISVANKKLYNPNWEFLFIRIHCCVDPMTVLVSNQADPHLLQQNCAHECNPRPHRTRTHNSLGSCTRPASTGTRNPCWLTRPAQDSNSYQRCIWGKNRSSKLGLITENLTCVLHRPGSQCHRSRVQRTPCAPLSHVLLVSRFADLGNVFLKDIARCEILLNWFWLITIWSFHSQNFSKFNLILFD